MVDKIKDLINDKPIFKILIPLGGIIIIGMITLIVIMCINKKPDITAGYDRVYTEEEIKAFKEQGLVRDIVDVTPTPEPVPTEKVKEVAIVSVLEEIKNFDWYDGTITNEDEENTFNVVDTDSYKRWEIKNYVDESFVTPNGYYKKDDDGNEIYVEEGLAKITGDYCRRLKEYNDKIDAYILLKSNGETVENIDTEEFKLKLEEEGIYPPYECHAVSEVFEAYSTLLPFEVEWQKKDGTLSHERLTIYYSDKVHTVAFIFNENGYENMYWMDEEGNQKYLDEFSMLNENYPIKEEVLSNE